MPVQALVAQVGHSLAELGYRVTPGRRPASKSGWRLKDRVLEGGADLRTLARNQVEVELASDSFADCVRNDWSDGMRRLQRQEAALGTLLREEGGPTAWVLVTAYYSAFFGAHELLKGMGRFVLYFDEEAIARIRGNAVGTHVLEPGNYAGIARNIDGTVQIRLAKTAARPHTHTWHSLQALGGSLKQRGADLALIERFLLFVGAGKRWPPPSDTRNVWNYSRPNWYAADGERIGKSMRILLTSTDAVFPWCRARKLPASQENIAASIAFVRCILLEATKNASRLFGA